MLSPSVCARLRESGRWPQIPVGINIGKSKVTPLEEAADDYLYSFRLLATFADYVVLNVSSPNTPGLRTLQEHEALIELAARDHAKKIAVPAKPILLKIAPDLSRRPISKQIIATCEENEIAGIIATNTTLDHSADSCGARSDRRFERPAAARKSTEFVRLIRSQLEVAGHRFRRNFRCRVSASEKFDAGAQLFQIYTGYIYRGPGLLREITDGLS